jgi:hypothetical protein
MPLIALTAFYCLERLAKEVREQEELSAPVAATHAGSAIESAGVSK